MRSFYGCLFAIHAVALVISFLICLLLVMLKVGVSWRKGNFSRFFVDGHSPTLLKVSPFEFSDEVRIKAGSGLD
jgi:hypothetical protein